MPSAASAGPSDRNSRSPSRPYPKPGSTISASAAGAEGDTAGLTIALAQAANDTQQPTTARRIRCISARYGSSDPGVVRLP
jgi:hypothetical protein